MNAPTDTGTPREPRIGATLTALLAALRPRRQRVLTALAGVVVVAVASLVAPQAAQAAVVVKGTFGGVSDTSEAEAQQNAYKKMEDEQKQNKWVCTVTGTRWNNGNGPMEWRYAFIIDADCVGRRIHVHLGDSFASGPGAENYRDGAPCWRSRNSYAELYAAQHDLLITNNSCSGSVAADVPASQGRNLNANVDIVTLQVGGNDIGFVNIIHACRFSIGDCTQANMNARDSLSRILPAALTNVYVWIAQNAPNAKVRVMGYPRPYNATTLCLGGVGAEHRAMINETIRLLNEVLKNSVSGAYTPGGGPFSFGDVDANFEGHRFCDPGATDPVGAPSVNRYLFDVGTAPLDGSPGAYHPTQAGHRNGYLPALSGL
jgi:lysophospholipase L1-like esterase